MARRLLLFSLLALSSCTKAPVGVESLDVYLERLSGAVDMPLPPARVSRDAPGLPPAPRSSIAPSTQIDLIDFLSLSGCALQVNLGRRNSQLGRTASPSQRLILDLEFLELAPDCAALLRQRGDDTLADTLDQASEQRRQQLPQSIYEAILAGVEWQSFWASPTRLGHYPAHTGSEVSEALSQLTALSQRWLDGDWRASNREFELLLSALRAGDGGALMVASAMVHRALERANQLLVRTRQEKPLCPFGQVTPRAEALQRVVQRFFVGGVQPWLVKLRQRKELLSAPVTELENTVHGVQSPQYRDWVNERDALLEGQTEAIKTHVRAIQVTLAQCESGGDTQLGAQVRG